MFLSQSQGPEMALAGNENVFGMMPAGDAQQFGAQQFDAQPGFGRKRNGDGVAVRIVFVVALRFAPSEIDLVLHGDSLQSRRQLAENLAVGITDALSGIHQQKHHIGPLDFLPAALDADSLDDIIGVAQAGGVDDVQRNALDLDGRTQGIAGATGNGRDDGQIVAGKTIEQR